MITGEDEFAFSGPLRHALVESQWGDPALRPLMEALYADRKVLLGPNSRVHLQLAADYGLQGLVGLAGRGRPSYSNISTALQRVAIAPQNAPLR